MTASFAPIDDMDRLARMWRDLEPRSEHSIFQSWGWIGTWLRTLPSGMQPEVLVVRSDGGVVGLGILFNFVITRHGWLRSRGLILHETGDEICDALTVEYNGILADRNRASDIVETSLEFLVKQVPGWDELHLGGVEEQYRSFACNASLSVQVRACSACHYVDLDALRNAGGDYLACLSRNTRYQIRRAMRRYEKIGALEISAATNLDEALRFFSEMKILHQAYWTGRGQPGSFHNPYFERFHTAFIEDRFAYGEVELLRAKAGPKVIGYLYNLIRDGYVYAYQSGFDYGDDNSLKPGLVSHMLALQRNLAGGAAVYDFMAGEAQHKRSLGTHKRELIWISARLPRLKYCIEDVARSIKHRLCRSV